MVKTDNKVCDINNITADGWVCGSVDIIDGQLIPVQWRDITLERYYCECGEYFTQEELITHLRLEGVE